MGLFDSLFGRKSKKTLEEADQINRDFIAKNPEAKNDEDSLMRQASGFMTSGKFNESRELYQKLAENYPDKKGLYLSQVGASLYFLQEYEQAINTYVEARNNGADASMMDDNIWEACETIYKQANDKASLEKYIQLCPDGRYTKKANKLLAK